jgi:hypothetical protein
LRCIGKGAFALRYGRRRTLSLPGGNINWENVRDIGVNTVLSPEGDPFVKWNAREKCWIPFQQGQVPFQWPLNEALRNEKKYSPNRAYIRRSKVIS